MKKSITMLLGLGLLALPGVSLAGYRAAIGVSVDTTSRVAAGSVGGARNTTNSVEYIDLAIQASQTDEVLLVSVRNAAGVSAVCTSRSAYLRDVARSINGDSYVRVNWDATGTCTSLEVRSTSYVPPKVL